VLRRISGRRCHTRAPLQLQPSKPSFPGYTDSSASNEVQLQQAQGLPFKAVVNGPLVQLNSGTFRAAISPSAIGRNTSGPLARVAGDSLHSHFTAARYRLRDLREHNVAEVPQDQRSHQARFSHG
jgi:hypothetical protein